MEKTKQKSKQVVIKKVRENKMKERQRDFLTYRKRERQREENCKRELREIRKVGGKRMD